MSFEDAISLMKTDRQTATDCERDARFAALDALFSKLANLSDQTRMIAALEAVTEVTAIDGSQVLTQKK